MGRFTGMFLLILIASQGAIAPCLAAGLVIEALDSNTLPGANGSFDIVLINTNASGGNSYNVAVDSLDISLSGHAGITITDVTMGTSQLISSRSPSMRISACRWRRSIPRRRASPPTMPVTSPMAIRATRW